MAYQLNNYDHKLTTLKTAVKNGQLDPARISSFVLLQEDHIGKKIESIVGQLELIDEITVLKQLHAGKNIILKLENSQPRLLAPQTPIVIDNQSSQLFLNMTPSILSGLLVGLFLLFMICIALGCLFDVKTNDRFARNHLWIGRES